jgi:methylglutaconyl-CoA hydratase
LGERVCFFQQTQVPGTYPYSDSVFAFLCSKEEILTDGTEDVVEVSLEGNVLTVALNRPDHHNALNASLARQLASTFEGIDQRKDVRVVVLTGNGRTFCAGADLAYMRAAGDFSHEDNVADAQRLFDLMMAIDSCEKPVVGRINGSAVGGGVGLVCCCDIVVAMERAKFGFSEVRLGLVPAVISPFVLARIGATKGRELFLTGERIEAEVANRIGLVDYVVKDNEELDERVQERIGQLLLGAPGAQITAKELVRTVADRPKASVREFTAELIARRRVSAEGQEGMSSFLEKHKPSWQ